MSKEIQKTISVVVPVYNEAPGLARFHKELMQVVDGLKGFSFEVLYCDDGSTDESAVIIQKLCRADKRVKLLKLSRNFGKEYALTAGMVHAKGSAIITLDADGQHPVELLPDFMQKWQSGARVVVGIHTKNRKDGLLKRFMSALFYKLINASSDEKMVSGSTDYRLIDTSVRQAFLALGEGDRMTRSLIDWLGFEKAYITFHDKPRLSGTASYSSRQLARLAVDSFVARSPAPLYSFGYLGVFITATSFLVGMAILIQQLILEDPWNWNFSGTAMLGILILFLVGIILMSLGVLSLYVSRIHNQSRRRPLYVVDYRDSVGMSERDEG